jgi:outer membrane protein
MKPSRSLVLALAVAAVFAALPSFAADRAFDVTGWASWIDPNSSGTFNSSTPNQPFDINLDAKLGYGAAVNIFWGQHLSTEFSASAVNPEARSRVRASGPNAGNSIGSLKMIPITATLQFHLAPNGRIDPYFGAGAAYVLFDNLSNIHDAGNLGLNSINFKDDVGLVVNGGIGFGLTNNIALLADVKYVPLKSAATAVFANGTSASQDIKVNPVLFSAGLSFRF